MIFTVILTSPLLVMLNYVGVEWYLCALVLILAVKFNNITAITKFLKYISIPLIVIEIFIYYQPGIIKLVRTLVQGFIEIINLPI